MERVRWDVLSPNVALDMREQIRLRLRLAHSTTFTTLEAKVVGTRAACSTDSPVKDT